MRRVQWLWAAAALWACGPSDPPAPEVLIVGERGIDDGRFHRPRAIAGAPDGSIYVIDKTGRIQNFDAAGRYVRQWSPPDVSNGQPIDLVVADDGTLFVCDTHQSRILVYAPDGTLLRQWGRHGRAPGEFLFPVGIAIGPAGEIFVSEYGGNDRIQVFTPDGEFLRQWGSMGKGPGQFRRPQDVAFGPNGDVIVCEYGNHRLQRFHTDGSFIAARGEAGDGPGQLVAPWDIELLDEIIIIVDTENHRLQYWPLAWLGGENPKSKIQKTTEIKIFVGSWILDLEVTRYGRAAS